MKASARSDESPRALSVAQNGAVPKRTEGPSDGWRRLGHNQKRFVFAETFSSSSYMIAVAHRLVGTLDVTRLKRCLDEVYQRHAALRSEFDRHDGEYKVRVRARPAYAFHRIDVDDDSFSSFRSAALPLIFEAIDLSHAGHMNRVILGRAGERTWRLCFVAHHTVTDGLSRSRFFEEVLTLYRGDTLESVRPFYDISDAIDPVAKDSDLAFWRKWASDGSPQSKLPGDFRSFDPGQSDVIDRPLRMTADGLTRAAKAMGASKFSVLAAAYSLALSRLIGADTIATCFQSAGRRTIDAPLDVIGPFSNTLPIRLAINEGATFADLAREAKAETRSAVRHERIEYDVIRAETGVDTDFVINTFPPEPTLSGGSDLEVGPREFVDRKTEYAINLMWSEDGGAMFGRIFFNPTRYRRDRLTAFLDQQLALVRRGLEAPDTPLSTLYRDTRIAPPRAETAPAPATEAGIADAFVQQADQRPERTALIDHKGQCSYAELLDAARQVAAGLRQSGATADDTVAIFAERNREFVSAVLGAALSGVAFAVIDVEYPVHRQQRIIHHLQPKFALQATRQKPTWVNLRWVERHAGGLAPPAGPRSEVAYYLFTSGTTGEPRCFGHPHAALVQYCAHESAALGVSSSDRVTLASGLAHDPVLRDIFVPLSKGAAIVCPEPGHYTDPKAFRAFLMRSGATIAHLTPPLGHLLSLGARKRTLAGLRAVVWGGDQLTADTLARFAPVAPHARHWNLYGSTETPQAAAMGVVQDNNMATIPLGHAVPGIRTEILDAEDQRCGVGEQGQIVVNMPFVIREIVEGRIHRTFSRHRTGDHAVYAPDGAMLFVGRRDDQVKIRGYRVELGDVTSAIKRLANETSEAGPCDAITLLGPDGQRLFGFVRFTGDTAQTQADALHARLKEDLPSFMVPDRVVAVDTLPLLPNGKLDRASLRARITPVPVRANHETRPLTTPLEREIAERFGKITGQTVTDANMSLFALGADSLTSIEARLALEGVLQAVPDQWEDRAIHELAQLAPTEPRARFGDWFALHNVETFVPLRALAIFCIVAEHLSFFNPGGGYSHALLLLAGLAFGRFQSTAVLKEGRTGRLWALVATILVSVIPVSIAIVVLQAASGQPWSLSTLLLYANWLSYDPAMPGRDGRLIWLWYIHTYLHVFAGLALMVTVGSIRRWVARAPFKRFTQLWLAGLVVAQATRIAVTGDWFFSEHAMATYYWPTTHAPTVLLGVVVSLAKTGPEKGVAAAMLCILAAATYLGYEGTTVVPMLATGLLVLTMPYVRFPLGLVGPVTQLAGASLFVYLMHYPLVDIAERTGWGPWPPAVNVVWTILLSMAIWSGWKRVLTPLRVRALATRKISFG